MALRAAQLAVIVALLAIGGAAASTDPALSVLWPMPSSVTHGGDSVALTTFGEFV